MSRFPASLLLLASLVVLGGSCCRDVSSAGGGEPRSVLLVSVDALRADALRSYGAAEPLPALDALADAGTVFQDAVTVVPQARPAAATLLTGATPDRHGVRDDVADRLGGDVRTVAVAAREAGARTGAFVGTPLCSFASGLDRGFDLFDGPEDVVVGPAVYEPMPRPAAEKAANAATWIGGLPAGTPFFAWVHLADLFGASTGADPNVEASVDQQQTREAYRKALAEVDGALGRVVAAARARGGALDIVLVGTHGAYLGEQKRHGAAFWLTDETLRVPLLWSGEGVAKGPSDVPAWLPDVPATIAARTGWTLPAGEGRNLFAAQGARRTRHAWSWAPDDQLGWPALAARREGRAWVPDTSRPAVLRKRALSEGARAALAAAGVALGPGGGAPLPVDDAARNLYLMRLHRIRHSLSTGVRPAAGRAARALVDDHPDGLGALLSWTYVLLIRRDAKGATEQGDRLLERWPDRGEALHWAAHTRWSNLLQARTLLEAAWEVGPKEPEILYDLACARALSGDTKGGLEALGGAVKAGYRDWAQLEADGDLASVRADPGYAALLRAHGR